MTTATKEFDVWLCFVNGRTSYKAVPVSGPVDQAQEPSNALKHLDRVEGENKRDAISRAAKFFVRYT